jgi:hypothetical protein
VLVLVVLAPPVVRAARPSEPRPVLVAPVRTHTESRGGIGNGARISRKPTDDDRGFFCCVDSEPIRCGIPSADVVYSFFSFFFFYFLSLLSVFLLRDAHALIAMLGPKPRRVLISTAAGPIN